MQHCFTYPSIYNLLIVIFGGVCSIAVDAFAFHRQISAPSGNAAVSLLVHQRCTKRRLLGNTVNMNENSNNEEFYWNKKLPHKNGNSLPNGHSGIDPFPPPDNSATNDDKYLSSQASNDIPTNTVEFLSLQAEEWIKAELSYYRHRSNDHYFPMITEKRGVTPPIQHLEAAAKEFEKRFSINHTTVYEEKETMYQSPFLLVANNVREDWCVPESFRTPVRFMLVPGETHNTSTLVHQGFGRT
jgi:hypothetical protein